MIWVAGHQKLLAKAAKAAAADAAALELPPADGVVFGGTEWVVGVLLLACAAGGGSRGLAPVIITVRDGIHSMCIFRPDPHHGEDVHAVKLFEQGVGNKRHQNGVLFFCSGHRSEQCCVECDHHHELDPRGRLLE